MRVFIRGAGRWGGEARERGKGTQGERGSENRWAARGYDYKKRHQETLNNCAVIHVSHRVKHYF